MTGKKSRFSEDFWDAFPYIALLILFALIVVLVCVVAIFN